MYFALLVTDLPDWKFDVKVFFIELWVDLFGSLDGKSEPGRAKLSVAVNEGSTGRTIFFKCDLKLLDE